jgi:hypothetical protein
MTGAWYPRAPMRVVLLCNRYSVSHMKQLLYVSRCPFQQAVCYMLQQAQATYTCMLLLACYSHMCCCLCIGHLCWAKCCVLTNICLHVHICGATHTRIHTCSVYARAFREGFTVTLVSGRTVGIGAYLARLGRRSTSLPFTSDSSLLSPVQCSVLLSVTSDSSLLSPTQCTATSGICFLSAVHCRVLLSLKHHGM